jgi:hypothetical protein
MRPGDVLESVGERGRVVGELVDVRAPLELPDLPGMPAMPARAVLAEMGVLRVAMIAYEFGALPVMFAACEVPGGEWYDLQGQLLYIRVLPMEVC